MIAPSFQGVNRLSALSYEKIADREVYTRYYFPRVQVKDYNAMIDGRNIFDWANQNYEPSEIDLSKPQALDADQSNTTN